MRGARDVETMGCLRDRLRMGGTDVDSRMYAVHNNKYMQSLSMYIQKWSISLIPSASGSGATSLSIYIVGLSSHDPFPSPGPPSRQPVHNYPYRVWAAQTRRNTQAVIDSDQVSRSVIDQSRHEASNRSLEALPSATVRSPCSLISGSSNGPTVQWHKCPAFMETLLCNDQGVMENAPMRIRPRRSLETSIQVRSTTPSLSGHTNSISYPHPRQSGRLEAQLL